MEKYIKSTLECQSMGLPRAVFSASGTSFRPKPSVLGVSKKGLCSEICQIIALLTFTQAACEMYPAGVISPIIHEGYTFQFKWMDQPSNIKLLLENPSSTMLASSSHYLSSGCQLWNIIISQYTQRFLTQEEDKLIAIAGVARAIENAVRNRSRDDSFGYLAG